MKGLLSKNQAKYIKSLQQKKYRDEEGRFVVEGEKSVDEALTHAGIVEFIVCQSGLVAGRDEVDLPVYQADQRIIDSISSQRSPSGIMAVCRIPKRTEPLPNQSIIALDGIADPGNLGTIIRLCDWFNYRYIFLGTGSVDPYNPKVVQSSMGSIFRIQFGEGDLFDFINRTGITTYAADMGGTSLYETEFSIPHMLIMGSESHGVDHRLLANTARVTIPRYADCESINVANAAGIILAEIRRRYPNA